MSGNTYILDAAYLTIKLNIMHRGRNVTADRVYQVTRVGAILNKLNKMKYCKNRVLSKKIKAVSYSLQAFGLELIPISHQVI